MFDKILIANRGEIACRVAMTARRLGVRTVAVYSDADRAAKHVHLCDEAWAIGPAPARESYLRGDVIIDVARRTGARAIHPGYGFLSENEVFARAIADAGLVFIGPPPTAIAAMGSKSAAKALMATAGVPLVPGYHGDDQDAALLRAQAQRIGYPVMIKASAGGGGKGMRLVTGDDQFDAMLASCQRESRNAFGDDRVLVERFVERPRHIEIQVFADTHGNAVSLFERDCSVQRRHQKVIEEAPAPGMTDERRRAMGEAAVAAARAVGYVGAGTVEFIADPSGNFYFMEMNTRLQVEHPVTEMITGQDLVEWQLRVAAGEPLPCAQAQLAIRGHAIEARIYAENADKGFLPSIGRLAHLRTPPSVAFERGASGDGTPAAVRIDSGVRAGDEISGHYDPMIAKLITWGPDRDTAIRRMQLALAGFEVVGPSTNVDFLGRLMTTRAFTAGDLDTALIEREQAALFPAPSALPLSTLAVAAAAVIADENAELEAVVASGWHDPFAARSGWRLNSHQRRELVFHRGDETIVLSVEYAPDGYTVRRGGDADGEAVTLAELSLADGRLTAQVGGRAVEAGVVIASEVLHLFLPSGHLSFGYALPLAHAGEDAGEDSRLTAPMPGKVIALMVDAQARVTKGQPLLVMEAMKMEHTICAPADGRVTGLLYRVGEQVAEGAQLISFEATTEAGAA